MPKRWQFLYVLTPPSAAAGSSKEVKLGKTCGRPILWSGGGTRIHNFPLPGDIFGVVASTTRRDICRPTGGQEWVDKKSPMPPITLKVRRNWTDKSSWKFYRQKWCQVLTRVKFCYRWNCRRRTIAWNTKISLTKRANLRDNGKL